MSPAGICSIILFSSKNICFHLQVAYILLQQKFQAMVKKGEKLQCNVDVLTGKSVTFQYKVF